MERVLAIDLDDDAFDAVSTHARDLELSRISRETAASAIGEAEQLAAIVVGGFPDPIALVRRCYAAAPLTPVIILTSAARCGDVRNALRFSPNVGREVHCVALDEPDLDTRIRAIIQRGKLRTSTAKTLSALNGRLAAALPPLRSSALVLDRLLEVAPVGIVVLDEHRAIRIANPRASSFLGVEEIRAAGRDVADSLSEADRPRLARMLDRSADHPNPRESFDLDVGGSQRRIEATSAALTGPGAGGYLLLLEDTTERHALLTQLRQANRRKDEFLALLGHELRNPLAPIRTAVDLLGLRGLASIERECAIIDRQLTHITHLVDDLLDISRITQGRVDLQRAHHDLAAIVDMAVEAITPSLGSRGHTLTVDVERGAYVLDVDAQRIDQVVINLLNNAVRYSGPGTSIRVSAAAVDGGRRVELSVRDSGNGIEPALLPHIFEMFVQAEQLIDRATGGLGLGLTIVRSLVELHGGSVRVTTELGVGSEFIVDLPLVAGVVDSANPADLAAPTIGGRVLVVDDNEDAAVLLSDLLEAFGYETHVAHTGLSGLEVAERTHPDLVLLDIGLPGIDGYEVGRRLQAIPELRKTKIVALTGFGQAEDRARSAAAGFHDHLVKPLSTAALKSTLSTVFPADGVPETPKRR